MGGESNTPKVTQTAKTTLSPEQQKIFDLALPYAEQAAGAPTQMYQGSGVAGFDPLQTQAQQQLVNGVAPKVQGMADQSAAAQSQMLDPDFMLDVANNPYIQAIQQSITSNATDNLQEKILPGARSGATMSSGMYSGASSRDAIREGQAIGDTGAAIGDSTAKLFFDAYNRGLTGMESAIGRTGQVQGQQLMAPGILDAVGTQQQGMQQAQLDEDIKKFYTAQQLPMLKAQELMGLVKGMPGGETTGTVTGAVPKPSGVQQGIGILSALLSLA